MSITASSWREFQKNTLRGFITLTLSPSGLIIRDCTFHEKGGARWIGLPGKPVLEADGHHQTDVDGKRLYVPVVELPDTAARGRFQTAALAAVDALLESTTTKTTSRSTQRPTHLHLALVPGRSASLPDDDVSDLWSDPEGAA